MKRKIIGLVLLVIFSQVSYGWDIKDVFNGMSTNITKGGSYETQAAGYYSGGGMSMRTNSTAFNPISVTPPNLNMSCNGIDAYMGSFSIISGAELVNLAKNIGSQAQSYAFQLGLKTFAPQIENLLKDLRNLAMELNQAAKGDCVKLPNHYLPLFYLKIQRCEKMSAKRFNLIQVMIIFLLAKNAGAI